MRPARKTTVQNGIHFQIWATILAEGEAAVIEPDWAIDAEQRCEQTVHKTLLAD